MVFLKINPNILQCRYTRTNCAFSRHARDRYRWQAGGPGEHGYRVLIGLHLLHRGSHHPVCDQVTGPSTRTLPQTQATTQRKPPTHQPQPQQHRLHQTHLGGGGFPTRHTHGPQTCRVLPLQLNLGLNVARIWTLDFLAARQTQIKLQYHLLLTDTGVQLQFPVSVW